MDIYIKIFLEELFSGKPIILLKELLKNDSIENRQRVVNFIFRKYFNKISKHIFDKINSLPKSIFDVIFRDIPEDPNELKKNIKNMIKQLLTKNLNKILNKIIEENHIERYKIVFFTNIMVN